MDMKKILIILIAVLTCLALGLTVAAGVALSRDHRIQAPAETTENTLALELTQAPQTEAPPRPTETVPVITVPSQPEDPFRESHQVLFASGKTAVRQEPEENSLLLGYLNQAAPVQQTHTSESGWSRIKFRGETAYVLSSQLTDQKPQSETKPESAPETAPEEPLFRNVDETVYSTGSLHVRSGPGTDYKSIGYLKPGSSARRIGVSTSGWSKIRYENKDAYVSSQYLSTQKPAENSRPPVKDQAVYQKVDETVYSLASVNLRSGPGTDYKAIGYLQPGDSARRIGIGDNGWSKIRYQKQEAYVASKYITTQAPGSDSNETQPAETVKPSTPGETKPAETVPTAPEVHYEKRDDTLVASQALTLRAGPGTGYSSLGQLTKGSLVHRIAVGDNGWSIILLSGKEVYVETAYLEKEKAPEQMPQKPTEPPAEKGPVYEKVTQTVSATDNLNVRKGPGTTYEKIGKLKKGEKVTRVGVGSNGWSVILYREQQAYVDSRYVTEESAPSAPEENDPIVFEKKEDTVYAVDGVNIRVAPSVDSKSLGTLSYGDSIQRTGVSSSGWSRVLYDDQEAYAVSRYLSEEKPEIPDFGDTTSPGFATPNAPFIYQYRDGPDLIPYAVFEPVAAENSPLPLIISLHGSLEVGKDRAFMEQQHLTKVFREWEYTGLDPFDAYVVCPHLSKKVPFKTWGQKEAAEEIFRLIAYFKENYDIDENKIILEGHSMGGQGALYIAADDRACFSKLVVVSGYDAGIDYNRIQIPVRGCCGGKGPTGPMDSPHIYNFMNGSFRQYFGEDSVYEGPYTHDDVAIKFFQKDEDGDHKSDIIQWMLQ